MKNLAQMKIRFLLLPLLLLMTQLAFAEQSITSNIPTNETEYIQATISVNNPHLKTEIKITPEYFFMGPNIISQEVTIDKNTRFDDQVIGELREQNALKSKTWDLQYTVSFPDLEQQLDGYFSVRYKTDATGTPSIEVKENTIQDQNLYIAGRYYNFLSDMNDGQLTLPIEPVANI